MSEPVRVLGRRRLSREFEGSTSIPRQGGYIQDWVTNVTQETGVRHILIGWADDIDVSGSRDPFETPGLGPWLRPIDPTCETGACGHTPDTPCMGQWDVLACWKIDRLSRRTIHSYKLLQWCKSHGKRIKATNDAIDPDSRVGELIWFILSWLAEGELEAIKERSAGTRQWLIKTDRYPGGWVPYGYRPAPHPDGEGWTLVPDPDMRSVINQMITWILDEGRSAYWTAMRLNEMGIPSPAAARGYNWYKNRSAGGGMSTGGRWSTTSVLAILRSKSLLGIRTHKGEVVLSESTGLPVRFAEPLISDQRYTELQETLNRTHQPRGNQTQNLPSFAKCAVCDHAMYRHSGGPRTRRYIYLICSGRHGDSRFKEEGQRCRASMVPEREAWNYLETYLLDHIGDKPWLERVVIPGSDHTRELEEAEKALELLLSRAATIVGDRLDVDVPVVGGYGVADVLCGPPLARSRVFAVGHRPGKGALVHPTSGHQVCLDLLHERRVCFGRVSRPVAGRVHDGRVVPQLPHDSREAGEHVAHDATGGFQVVRRDCTPLVHDRVDSGHAHDVVQCAADELSP